MPLPLQGVTILDFSTLLPGPLATFMLAEAGAEVIKVEKPGGERSAPLSSGDRRSLGAVRGPERRQEEHRGRSETLGGDGRACSRSSRAPTSSSSNFGPASWIASASVTMRYRAVNPRAIYCSITGYGQDGPGPRKPDTT